MATGLRSGRRNGCGLLDRFVEDGAAQVHFGRYCLLERFQQVNQIQADYFRRNLPALRAWGIGLMLPWDYPSFFRRNTDNFPLKPNPDRLKGLNEPGIVPDNFRWGDYFVTPYPQNYTRTAIGDVVHEWNQPLIAWIGGGESFTTQEHNYRPGDTVRKQLVILNDLRTRVGCSYSVRIKEQPASAVRGDVEIAPGGKALIPVALSLPPETAPGSRTLIAEFRFGNGEKRSHTFPVHILPAAAVGKLSPVALHDPKGETEALLKRLGIPFRQDRGNRRSGRLQDADHRAQGAFRNRRPSGPFRSAGWAERTYFRAGDRRVEAPRLPLAGVRTAQAVSAS